MRIISHGSFILATCTAFLGRMGRLSYAFSPITTPARNSFRLYSAPAKESGRKIPVNLLAGFLGSGKTTTVENLLKTKDGMKIGLIVNDVAAVNIDNKLIANPKVASEGGTIELQNGCACCSLADELLTSIEQLMIYEDGSKRDLDTIVVELSGVADPNAVLANWEQAKFIHHPVTKYTKMDKVVTLVDASTFGTDWMTMDKTGDREGWVEVEDPDSCCPGRMIPDLLTEQIEAADVLVINKVDLAGEDQVTIASNLARGLNSRAKLVETQFGDISVKEVFEASRNAEADKKTESVFLNQSKKACTKNLGITNFVYKRNKPFSAARLLALLKRWPIPIKEELNLGEVLNPEDPTHEKPDQRSPFIGVLRSKGFCWISPTTWVGEKDDTWRHDTAMYWSQAGKHIGISSSSEWWATISKEELRVVLSKNKKELERILREDFVSEEFGDRRQELVFIGANFDEAAINQALDKCLYSDGEMVDYTEQLHKYKERIADVE